MSLIDPEEPVTGGIGIGSIKEDSMIPVACTTPLPTRSNRAPAWDTVLFTLLAESSIADRALSVANLRSFWADDTASVKGLLEYEDTDFGAAGLIGLVYGAVGRLVGALGGGTLEG
jgi:hypothetical protein